jgi:trans-aconitate methyltransferase
MSGDHIIEQYEKYAETWVQARLRERSFPEKGWLDRFCALVPSHANILDCGCGAGEPIARYLTAQGLTVTGIDSSETMVRMFRDRLPDQRALVQDMRKLSLAETFDGILAWDASSISTMTIRDRCSQSSVRTPNLVPLLCLRLALPMAKRSECFRENRSTMPVSIPPNTESSLKTMDFMSPRTFLKIRTAVAALSGWHCRVNIPPSSQAS